MPSLIPPLKSWLRRAHEAGLDLLFPPHCAACHAELLESDGQVMLCSQCRSKLRLTEGAVCPRCAAMVPEADGVRLGCSYCQGLRLRFDRAIALRSYEGFLRELILRWKEDRLGIAQRSLLELV